MSDIVERLRDERHPRRDKCPHCHGSLVDYGSGMRHEYNDARCVVQVLLREIADELNDQEWASAEATLLIPRPELDMDSQREAMIQELRVENERLEAALVDRTVERDEAIANFEREHKKLVAYLMRGPAT